MLILVLHTSLTSAYSHNHPHIKKVLSQQQNTFAKDKILRPSSKFFTVKYIFYFLFEKEILFNNIELLLLKKRT